MTLTSDHHPTSPPLPGALLSNPDLTKLYMSSSCPELKAESVISFSSDEEFNNERLPLEPLVKTHEEAAFSMDPLDFYEERNVKLSLGGHSSTKHVKFGPVDPPAEATEPPAIQPSISSISSTILTDMSNRRKLQWKFKGLTLWLELEEFDNDITNAISYFSSRHSSPLIPKSHTTAIYGMEHLTPEEASRRLHKVKEVLSGGVWPKFCRPTGVTSDIAEDGKPGQVCSIAWSELTLATSDEHERALDELYRLFYEDVEGDCIESSSSGSSCVPSRNRPWKPHNSIAYDNPETNALSLLDTIMYASQHPSLLGKERRVEAISLWSTDGKMEDWVCIDRVRFW